MPAPGQANEVTDSAVVPENDAAETLARSLAGAHGSDRVRRALELLCEYGRATGGHLFVSSGPENGLEFAASVRESEPSAALTRFAEAFWSNQLEEAEMSAVLTELPWAQQSYKPFEWIDPRGELYEVLVLYSARVLPAHVGLACLCVGKREEPAEWSTALLSALASQLTESVRG